jgi:hydroxyacylglutathione hydrolase
MAEEPSPPRLRGAIVQVTQFQQNCGIFWDNDSKIGMVTDPGGDVPRILEAIRQTEAKIEKIVLTHGHLDHAGGAMELRDALGGVPIEGPDRRDAFLLDTIADQASGYGWEARNVTPDRWMEEGETLVLGPHSFDILHCPGHTPGSLVFVHHAARFIIAGDVLFQGSIGRTDFAYGSQDSLIHAIKTKLLVLADDYVFLPGHGPGSTIGAERATNEFLQ